MTIFHFDLPKIAVVTALACGFATLAPSQTRADELTMPSGQSLTLLDFISEQDGKIVRFRFLAPEIGAEFNYMDVFGDFQVICDEQVLPLLVENGISPTRIVLSMSALDVPFGEPAPDVLQFFEIFRPENGLCIWEEF